MKQMNYKKLIIPNIPYVFFVYLFDKVGQAVRLAPGADISEKILNITQGFSEAFSNALPSVHPLDLLIGIVGAVVIRLIVYVKGKNAKKYRKGAEYGSARWGNAEDIKPYIDPDFQNNIILTQTERLTMNSRPKQRSACRIDLAEFLIAVFIFCHQFRIRFYRSGDFDELLRDLLHTCIFPTGYCRQHGTAHGRSFFAFYHIHLQIQDIGYHLLPQRALGSATADLGPLQMDSQRFCHLQ